MWLFGGMQFFVNVSWVFLITSLPDFLKDRYAADTEDGRADADGAPWPSAAWGWPWADCSPTGCTTVSARAGAGPSRSAVVMVGCAITYVSATMLPTAWAVIVALGVMAFLVDLANPTIWAFAQDVGGRYVGASLGWGNMLGNFGAAASPILLQLVRKSYGWDVAFLICAGSFVLAGCVRRRAERPDPGGPRDRAGPGGGGLQGAVTGVTPLLPGRGYDRETCWRE